MSSSTSLPPNDLSPVFYIGQHESQRKSPVTLTVLGQAQQLGYEFLTTPITTASFQSRVLTQASKHLETLSQASSADEIPVPVVSPLGPSDTTLAPEDSNASLFAVVSPWIDLGSSDPIIAHVSRQVLNVEVAYAAFCGINNVVLHGPIPGSDVTQCARAVVESLGLGPHMALSVLLPMEGELEQDHGDGQHLSGLMREQYVDETVEDDEADQNDPCDAWNAIRTLSNYSPKLSIALEIPRQLPSATVQSRWFAEPVRFLDFPRTSFIRNAKGYPVLSKPHQQIISRYARLRTPPAILLSDVGTIQASDPTTAGAASTPTPAEAAVAANEKPKDPIAHLRYMRHLQHNQPTRDPIERFGQGYQDYLQSPLQPLTDNLESITYEVFEKDPVKYQWYERAIAAALTDLSANLGTSRPLNVAVVGAGRGPLVTRALQASESTSIPITCWAVEKNPNALVLLRGRNARDPLWNNNVHVVKSDMRHWCGPLTPSGEESKVDILVSELLGSFADNELSPECLDGVQHTLHPTHGLSIPASYTAHLTPLAAPKLHADLLSRGGTEKWELPYVVMLHQYHDLCTEPASPPATETDPDPATPSTTPPAPSQRPPPSIQTAWRFTHPLPPAILEQSRLRAGGSADAGGWVGGDGSNEHNARACKLSFTCATAGVCHGLGGYFETVLYSGEAGTVELSTNPRTMGEKSRDMISWFPIFFPLKTPIHLPDESEVEVRMWRQTDDRAVWYEWVVEAFGRGAGGKRVRVAMSELHSSRKNGCLM